MPFDISSYIEGLQRTLDRLRPQSRIAFAVWCADALFREVRGYLAAKTDALQRSAVQEAFDYLWGCASGDKPVDAEVRRLEQACAEIDWGEENVTDDEQDINVYAIEAISSLCCALGTCRTGSALSAAKAAENVLNKLDFQLSDELFVDNYSEAIWSDPKWKAELERQQKMLDFLRDNPGLNPEQRTLFRD
jgi:hypothetical protein